MVKRHPNWLMLGFITISIGVHALILLHITGLYRSKALTVIELTMRDISKPPVRDIPRPRIRHETPDSPKDTRVSRVTKTDIPKLDPMSIDPVEQVVSEGIVEKIRVPEIERRVGAKIAAWEPGHATMPAGDYLDQKDYLEMVRLRIESHKKYPQVARRRQIEGRTTVRFVIERDGGVTGLEVVRSSKNTALDRAAIAALREAAPFPIPPSELFKGSVALELTIVFELT